MKVCILAHNFPTFSETFVTDHAIALLESDIDLRVIANTADHASWDALKSHKDELKKINYLYQRPDSKRKNHRSERIKDLFKMAIYHVKHGSLEFFQSFNFIKYGSSVFDLKLPFVYNKALQIGNVDILHCHFGSNGVIGAHLKRLGFCKKLVVTFHGLDVSKVIITKKNEKIYRDLFNQADLILPISNLWRQALLSSGAPENKTIVHHLGVDVKNIPVKTTDTDTFLPVRIITTARFTEKKGLPIALKALAEAIKQNPQLNLQYDIIGSGKNYDQVEALITELALGHIVKLHGALPNSRVKELLYRSDIFMLPSHTAKNGDQEGIPVSLMEAMAAGLPVLSTRHSGIPELIEDGKSGILVEEKNYHQLADAIAQLAKDKELRDRLAYNGRQVIKQRFNADKQTRHLINLYENLLTS